MKILLLTLIFLTLQFTPSMGQTRSKQANVSKDTIYIPIDLNDCIRQLDKMFADSNKTKIKAMTEDEFSSSVHFGFGMWVRNNWGLWKGSRLSNYFREKGVYHPDDMSGIIFDSYYRHLAGQEIKFEEQIKYYQDYWENIEKQELERRRKEFANYIFGDTVLFRYKNGFVSKAQEDKYDNDLCTAKGVITEIDGQRFFIKVKLLDGCDKKGIISYDNDGQLVYNNESKNMEKPKRVIAYMKVGEESWFRFDDWEVID